MNIPNPTEFLNRLVAEMKSTKMWVVAIGLIVAIVALPLALSKNASTPSLPPAPVLPSGTAPAGTAQQALTQQTAPGNSNLRGRKHDPFIQQPLGGQGPAGSKAGSTTSQTATLSAGSSASTGTTGSSSTGSSSRSSTSGSTGSSTGGSTGTGSTPTNTAPAPLVFETFAVDIAFGKAQGKLRTYHNVERFMPLPSSKNPAVAFLGLTPDRKTVIFAVAPTASAAGDGRCFPNKGQCELLALKKGQQELVLAVNPNGSVTEYVLEVRAVNLVQTTSPNAGLNRISTAGRKAVRSSTFKKVRFLHHLRFARHSGLLISALPRARKNAASANFSITAVQSVGIGSARAGFR